MKDPTCTFVGGDAWGQLVMMRGCADLDPANSRPFAQGETVRNVRNTLGCLALVLAAAGHLNARTFYVSVTGSDLYRGTIDSSFATIGKGIAVAAAGDTILVRGGTYALPNTISISRNGTVAARFYLLAYPGEHPLLDFSAEAFGSRGINLSGSYWCLRGLDVYKAGDNGLHVSGSNNVIELCTFRENSDTGLQLDGGASNNEIVNCDSYYNVDPSQGNADGFAPKLGVGTGNYFYGCRSWQNSDDGWDGYLRPSDNVTTTLENCWCFNNGYLKDGTPSSGNGNGYKLGGGDSSNADSLRHNMILRNCLAFDNRVKGFDQNNNRGSMTLLNCTGYRNGTNYKISAAIKSGSVLTVENCVALGSYGSLASFAIEVTNSWMPPFVVTDSDFVGVDTMGVRGPRKADGSLPDLPFMHLAPGSDLIDAGTDVGLPFNGSAPDLGCFETEGSSAVPLISISPTRLMLEQNFPNPFNPETNIRFSVGTSGSATLSLFNALGQQVTTLFDGPVEAGRSYTIRLLGTRLASGAYFYRLRSGNQSALKKLVIAK